MTEECLTSTDFTLTNQIIKSNQPCYSDQPAVIVVERRTALLSCSPQSLAPWWCRCTFPARWGSSPTVFLWPGSTREWEQVKWSIIEGVMRLCWMFISVLAYVLIEVANLTGEHAVFVRQETEASLFFQQSLSAAVSNELLHVHLAWWDSLQVLQKVVTGQEVTE